MRHLQMMILDSQELQNEMESVYFQKRQAKMEDSQEVPKNLLRHQVVNLEPMRINLLIDLRLRIFRLIILTLYLVMHRKQNSEEYFLDLSQAYLRDP